MSVRFFHFSSQSFPINSEIGFSSFRRQIFLKCFLKVWLNIQVLKIRKIKNATFAAFQKISNVHFDQLLCIKIRVHWIARSTTLSKSGHAATPKMSASTVPDVFGPSVRPDLAKFRNFVRNLKSKCTFSTSLLEWWTKCLVQVPWVRGFSY